MNIMLHLDLSLGLCQECHESVNIMLHVDLNPGLCHEHMTMYLDVLVTI